MFEIIQFHYLVVVGFKKNSCMFGVIVWLDIIVLNFVQNVNYFLSIWNIYLILALAECV